MALVASMLSNQTSTSLAAPRPPGRNGMNVAVFGFSCFRMERGLAELRVTQWRMATSLVAGLEALMGTKDRGGRNTKKKAAKGLKEKRLDKKAKRAANESSANRSLDRTFGS
jgi:hypothetical protein